MEEKLIDNKSLNKFLVENNLKKYLTYNERYLL